MMSDKNFIDDGVPLVFRDPAQIIEKASKKKKEKKADKEISASFALQKTIAKELKEIKKSEKKQKRKPRRQKSKNNHNQSTENRPDGAYRKMPPECPKADYRYHGTKIPDPYRPLENVDNEKVKGWINYQTFRTKKYLAEAKLRLNMVDTIKKYAKIFDQEKPIQYYAYDGYALGPATYEGFEKTIRHSVFSLEFTDDHTSFYQKTPRKEKRLIFCDKDVKFKGLTVRLNRLKINPRATYAVCEVQDAVEEKKYDCVPLCLKTGRLYDIYDQDSLGSFICWDSKNNGYYFTKESCLYYCALRGKNYKTTRVDTLQYPTGSWRAGSYEFLKGHGIYFLYEEDDVRGSHFSKYHSVKKEFYVDFTKPCVLHEYEHLNFPRLKHPYRFISSDIIGIYYGYAFILTKDNLGKSFVLRMQAGEQDYTKAKCILHAQEISGGSANSILLVDQKIITIENEDLQTVLKIYTLDGKLLHRYKHETPASFCFENLNVSGHRIRFYADGFDRHHELYEIDTRTFTVKPISISGSIVDFDFAAKRIFVTSKDGTKVPMTLLYDKVKGLKQNTKTILYMYGGFGSCRKPAFQPEILAWIESGGVYAICHPRGDGGWRKNWAIDGSRRKFQNTLDDIAACGYYLIDNNISARSSLIGKGASNGGRTVAAVMLQNPELFKGIICQIPVIDMLNNTMGNFPYYEDAFIDPFGDYYDYQDFKVILETSPLHSIQDNVKYPPTLIMGQGKDDRAHPGHSLKFLATLLDRAKNDDFYLVYKEDGSHESLYKTDRFEGNPDYDVYASMFAFIEKNIEADKT